jgi:hypothetical protein
MLDEKTPTKRDEKALTKGFCSPACFAPISSFPSFAVRLYGTCARQQDRRTIGEHTFGNFYYEKSHFNHLDWVFISFVLPRLQERKKLLTEKRG